MNGSISEGQRVLWIKISPQIYVRFALSSFLSLGDFLHSCGTRSQMHPCSKSSYFSPEINFALAFQRAMMAEQLLSSVRHKGVAPAATA